jgi:hypothetical protein
MIERLLKAAGLSDATGITAFRDNGGTLVGRH